MSEYHDAHPITLGGEKRFLRISSRSLRYADKYHGVKPNLSAMGRDFSMISMLVWVGLLHEDKMLEEDDIMEMMDLEKKANLDKIMVAAGKALKEALNEMENFGKAFIDEKPKRSPKAKTKAALLEEVNSTT